MSRRRFVTPTTPWSAKPLPAVRTAEGAEGKATAQDVWVSSRYRNTIDWGFRELVRIHDERLARQAAQQHALEAVTDRLRVVQWTTGNVGKKSVHAIAENSLLNLAGCYAVVFRQGRRLCR